jgi:hypothetical protein
MLLVIALDTNQILFVLTQEADLVLGTVAANAGDCKSSSLL